MGTIAKKIKTQPLYGMKKYKAKTKQQIINGRNGIRDDFFHFLLKFYRKNKDYISVVKVIYRFKSYFMAVFKKLKHSLFNKNEFLNALEIKIDASSKPMLPH